MKRFFLAFLSFGLAASLAAAANAPMGSGQAAKKPTTSHKAASATAHRSLLNPASLNQKAPDVYKAKFTTGKGDFVIQVTRAWAPLGADRFYNLVKNGFFTDASFFRDIAGFMVQFGISAKPTVAKAWSRAAIPDDPVTQHNARGYITFATAGPNTRTTQVFINFGDNSRLDSDGFSPFGQVIEGMDVVDSLYNGYGEGAPQGAGPEQGRIEAEGKAYLDKEFPKLDSIKTAVIVPVAAAPGAAKKAPMHRAAASTKPKS